MTDQDYEIEVVDGIVFELRPRARHPSARNRVCLRKNRELTDRYLEHAGEFRGCRLMEIGIDRGGSTSFFFKLFHPQRLLAFDLSPKPVNQLLKFIEEHDHGQTVSVHWGISQDDRERVPQLVGHSFGDAPLDFIVDDASHLLGPSTATFEILFPRLRPGGVYVIEDWSADHEREKIFARAIERDNSGELHRAFAEAVPDESQRNGPLSLLVAQLVIASGYNPEWVSEVTVRKGYCELRRGSGDIPLASTIDDYVGQLGRGLFRH